MVTKQRDLTPKRKGQREDALLYGWLREVNWAKRTAQLHDYDGGYVQLRFGPGLAGDMLRLATQYVEVRGSGRFNAKDEWTIVDVRELRATRSWSEPFDVGALLNDPAPKIFDPRAMEPIGITEEEWRLYDQAIREGSEF